MIRHFIPIGARLNLCKAGMQADGSPIMRAIATPILHVYQSIFRMTGVTAVLLCGTADAALADWDYTRWGMTTQQVIDASHGSAHFMPPNQRYRNDADHYEITVEAHPKQPVPVNIGFQFDLPGGGLRCVIMNASGDNADTLQANLVERYGKPKSESSFGPVHMMQWSTPDTIELAANTSPKAAVVNQCAPGKS